MSSSVPPPARTSTGALIAAIAILAASALLFLAVWIASPTQDSHYIGLFWIGLLSLIFAIVCYFGRAFTRAGSALQMLSWGYAGFGFALLVGSLILGAPAIGVLLELIGLFLVAIMIGATAILAVWRRNTDQMTRERDSKREAWRASTPRSAFDYTTARPNVPSSSPTPPESSPPAAPPGASR